MTLLMVMFITILRSIISLHLKWSLSVNINMPITPTNTNTCTGWSGSNYLSRAGGLPRAALIPASAQIASVVTVLVTLVTPGMHESHCSHTATVTVQPDQWTLNRESLFAPLFQCEGRGVES